MPRSSPLNPHPSSPAELQARIQAERDGLPFLLLRDGTGTQRVVRLAAASERLTIGRGQGIDLALDWDDRVSRAHAELERVGDAWALVDDGLSRNGSFVNGKRLRGRRRLEDADELRFGGTRLLYRSPGRGGEATTTRVSHGAAALVTVSDAQRRVLVALCRPFADGDPWARPATNKQIAAELFLTVQAVKTHLRALFGRLGLEDLGQNEKRLRLAELALQAGLVTAADLQGQPNQPLGA